MTGWKAAEGVKCCLVDFYSSKSYERQSVQNTWLEWIPYLNIPDIPDLHGWDVSSCGLAALSRKYPDDVWTNMAPSFLGLNGEVVWWPPLLNHHVQVRYLFYLSLSLCSTASTKVGERWLWRWTCSTPLVNKGQCLHVFFRKMEPYLFRYYQAVSTQRVHSTGKRLPREGINTSVTL